VTETEDIIQINTSNNFTWKFYKDTAGYNEIWHNGSILVQNERWYLEYQQNPSTWKPRGIPYNVTYEQLEPHHVIVTRKYTDYVSTDFNVTFDFYSNNRAKISLIGDIGQVDDYRVRWQSTGINTEHIEHNSSSNHTKIWNGDDNDSMVFNYEDVYSSFGNITEVEVEHSANNHKVYHYFYVGELEVGNFTLDPTFGHEESSGWSTGAGTDKIRGCEGTPTGGSGTADSIFLYIYDGTTDNYDWVFGEEITCALYLADGNTFIKATEEKTDGGIGWFQFNFSSPKPTITDSTRYLISFWHDDYITIGYKTDSGKEYPAQTVSYGGAWPDPISSGTGYSFRIYCSYTVTPANTAPTVVNSYPVNSSVDQSLKLQCVVWVNDTDNDDLDCTWQSNVTDGSTWYNMLRT
jgi:hypothetical protein